MGFGPDRVRFVGHAIGLELNEPPALARGVQTPLVDGRRDRGRAEARSTRASAPSASRTATSSAPVGPEQLTLAGDDLISGRAVTPGIDAGLYRRLFSELAAIGAGPAGWNRLAWGPLEDDARSWFLVTAPASSASRSSRTAPATSGRSSPMPGAAPLVCAGSHVDTVLDGGAYDGALGVVAALVAVEAVRRERTRPAPAARGRLHGRRGGPALRRGASSAAACSAASSRSIRCSRASIATGTRCASSPRRAASQRASLADGAGVARADRRSGSRCTSSRASRSSTFLRPSAWRRGSRPASAGVPAFEGSANHAGTTPMAGPPRRARRRGRARSSLRPSSSRAAEPGAVATVGRIEARPGASNVIPGECRDHARRTRARRGGARARPRRDLRGGRRTDGVAVSWSRESLDAGSLFDDRLRGRARARRRRGRCPRGRHLGVRGP